MRKFISTLGLYSGFGIPKSVRGTGRTTEMLKRAISYCETERKPVAIIVAYSTQERHIQDELTTMGADIKNHWYYIFSIESFSRKAAGIGQDVKLFFDHSAIELMREESIERRNEALAAFDEEQEFLNKLASL